MYYLLYLIIIITTVFNDIVNDPPIYYYFQTRLIEISNDKLSIDGYIFGVKYSSQEVEISLEHQERIKKYFEFLSKGKNLNSRRLNESIFVSNEVNKIDLLIELNHEGENTVDESTESLNVYITMRLVEKTEALFDVKLVDPHVPYYYCRRQITLKPSDFRFGCKMKKTLLISGSIKGGLRYFL